MKFLGREREKVLLRDWVHRDDRACLGVIYGRRRVGKTRLVEEALGELEVLKFEGLEGRPSTVQQRQFLDRLAELTGRREYKLIKTSNWTDILVLLADYVASRSQEKPVVVFFDEFQWMAAGRTRLVSSLKYVWDNHFSAKGRVRLLLCGSVCSFLVKKVVRSRALYGRINLEIDLKPLRLPEIVEVFSPKRSLKEVVELYMALGGIPQYLQMVDPPESVRGSLERLCFSPNGYLTTEFERIFASHFGSNPICRRILLTLARKRSADREQLQSACGLASGGRITEYLEDLEMAGFLEHTRPVDKPNSMRRNRYRISDPYLLFYFRFIRPALRRIRQSDDKPVFSRYVTDRKYDAWRGAAFELVCHQHAGLVAEKLGFSAVSYEHGSWFSRSQRDGAAQIDLVFLRADRVATLCEIKFQDASIGTEVIAEVIRKKQAFPNPRRFTVELVLVTASPVTDALARERFFNRVLELDRLFG